MTEIIVPDPEGLILLSLDCDSPAQANEPTFGGRTQIVGLPGPERWFASIELDAIVTENDEIPWRRFVFGLRGIVNWFRLPVACQPHIGPMPVVGASPGSGYSLPLSGMQRDTTILSAGQYLTVPLPSGHFRLVSLASDIITDESGNATALLDQQLTETPTVGAQVESLFPFAAMRSENRRIGLAFDNSITGGRYSLVEAL